MGAEGTDILDLVVIGDVNEDLYARVNAYPRQGGGTFGTQAERMIGGTGLNIAVAAARQGLRVALLTALGEDWAGKAVLRAMQKEGVETTYVKQIARPTGNVVIVVDETREHTFFSLRVGCADWLLGREDVPNDFATSTRAIFLSGVVVFEADTLKPFAEAAQELFARARSAGTITFFDPNLRLEEGLRLPADAVAFLRDLANDSDFYLPNQAEYEAILAGAAMPPPGGRKASIIKAGGKGCLVYTAGERIEVPACRTDVVDTTGAGDSFDAGFAAGVLAGGDAIQAARYASAVAAVTVSRVGTLAAFPTRDELAGCVPSIHDGRRKPNQER